MKRYSFFLLLFMLAGCKLVETANQPALFRLAIQSRSNTPYQTWQMVEPGRFAEIKKNARGFYELNIRSMSGGYKQFLMLRYNIHDPETYLIVEIRDHEKKVRELSLQDLKKLKRSAEGNLILELD